MVLVGPPLSRGPPGSSLGLVLGSELFPAVKPQVVPSSILYPPSASVMGGAMTPQLPPEVLPVRMLLLTVKVPAST